MSQTAVTGSQDAPAFKSIHFIGIGGAGMSGIALVLSERGYQVTGSDLKTSRYVRELSRAGIDVRVGHDPATIDEIRPDVVVVSTAIPDTNVEVVRARELGIPVWPRHKILPILSANHITVAVSGTHGKTTTSSMVATMLDRMGLDPSFLIGGIVEGYGISARNGQGPYFVSEADESDESFLNFNPTVAIVTNVEADHLDHYGSLAKVEEAFCRFMSSVGENGFVIACGESPHLVELARSTGRHVITYGFDKGNDVVCIPGTAHHDFGGTFTVRLRGGFKEPVTIMNNPGRHNMLNATAALAAADALGLNTERAAQALSCFKGVRRRFTHVGDADGITLVDDYGHHPTEVRATLKAAKSLDFERVVTVFQPHRYTRLQALAGEFAASFSDADLVILIDVFPAGEMPIPGVTSKMLADKIREQNPGKPVFYAPDHPTLMRLLDEQLRPGDLFITMGAGDVTTVGPEYLEHLAALKREGGR